MGTFSKQPELTDTVLWKEFHTQSAFKARFFGMSQDEYIDECMKAGDILESFCKNPEISVRSISLFGTNLLKLFHVFYAYCTDKRVQMYLDVETLNIYVQKAQIIVDSIRDFLDGKPRSKKVDLDETKIHIEHMLKYGDDDLSFQQRPYFLREFQCALRKLISLVREHLICFSRMYTEHVRVAVLDVLDLKEEPPLDNRN